MSRDGVRLKHAMDEDIWMGVLLHHLYVDVPLERASSSALLVHFPTATRNVKSQTGYCVTVTRGVISLRDR
jgi:hypothetical protein